MAMFEHRSDQIFQINRDQSFERRGTIDLLKLKEVRQFAENVSVAGLEEAIKSKTKNERWLWRICVVVVLTSMLVESVVIGLRYRSYDDTVISDLEKMDRQPVFPNISICVPKMANKTKFQEIMVIPDDALILMKKINVTIEQLVDYVGSVPIIDLSTKGIHPGLVFAAEKVIDATVRKMPHSLTDFIQSTASPCSDILTDCTFEGRSFDCCSAATFSFVQHGHCYFIDVNKAEYHSSDARANIDRTRSDVLILHINLTTYWDIVGYSDGISPAGYYFHIGEPAISSTPMVIPTDMDATIVLAPALRVRQLRECVNLADAPSVLPYFSAYNSEGHYCMCAHLVETLRNELSCTPPTLTYYPTNATTCNIRIMLFVSQIFHGDDLATSADFKMMGSTMAEKEKEWYKFLTSQINRACPPLCSRWSYSVVSTSYSSIAKTVNFNMDDRKANISWSSVKILLPSSSYILHEESITNMIYLAICEIGGSMGVYAGLSMVTLFQLLFYGAFAICGLIKNGKRK